MTNIPDLGYQLAEPRYHHAPGYPRVDVYIRTAPSYHHFDPEAVNLVVCNPVSGGEARAAQSLTIYHPWSGEKHYQVLPGPIDMVDREGHKRDIFTFGGQLTVHATDELTILTFESPAPILVEVGLDTTARLLADETEIILAQRRSAWLPGLEGYEQRLIQARPDQLYAACLKALHERFLDLRQCGEETAQDFCNFIHGEISALDEQGEWPVILPSIEDLL